MTYNYSSAVRGQTVMRMKNWLRYLMQNHTSVTKIILFQKTIPSTMLIMTIS